MSTFLNSNQSVTSITHYRNRSFFNNNEGAEGDRFSEKHIFKHDLRRFVVITRNHSLPRHRRRAAIAVTKATFHLEWNAIPNNKNFQ